jgi:nucleoside-diphosphate-sugar epimerase
MKKVLVTGGSGFIGRHCLPVLVANGYEVHAVSIISEDPIPHIHWHVVDLLNPGEVNKLIVKVKPTHLLHLSWYMVLGKYWTSLENIRWVQASLELLRVFAANGGKRVVMAGTCAEYDWKYELYSEQTTPLVPATLYGACKHALQVMVDAFCKQTGLSYAWGRIFFLYGPYEHPDRLVSSVIRSLLQGEPARCSHGNQIRDFLHVEDAAYAFVTLLDSDMEGAVNIGRGTPVAIREVVEIIGDQLHGKHLIQLGVLPAPPNDPPALIADTHRLKSIGWLPKYDLKTGLEQTIAWWKTNLITAKRSQK